MSPYIARVRTEEYNNPQTSGYVANPITNTSAQVVEGNFSYEKPMSIKAMITRRINKSLGFCLILAIAVTFISYYISMTYEAKLNVLDANIVRLNAENQDLQTELDRYKSFNNVDSKIGEYGTLKKANKVIEVTAMDSSSIKPIENHTKTASSSFNWVIGY